MLYTIYAAFELLKCTFNLVVNKSFLYLKTSMKFEEVGSTVDLCLRYFDQEQSDLSAGCTSGIGTHYFQSVQVAGPWS